MELTGERIVLRDFREEDAAAFAAVLGDPRHQEFYGPGEGGPDHALKLVETFVTWAAERPRRNYQLAVVLRQSGELLGSCGLRGHGRKEGEAEFGLGLAADSWGRGYGREAACLLLGFGFRELGLQQVVGISVTENSRVSRLVQGLGFERASSPPGTPWMTERGWTYTEWRLTAERWENRARRG
jgi:[ribosomal protein S5]-alanine N-acetyltransferase